MKKIINKTIVKVVVYIVIFVILAGTIAMVFRFTNGFNEPFKTFYVEYNGEQITASKTKISLLEGKKHRFDVKYTFNYENTKLPFNVSIRANNNAEESFDFMVDENIYAFYAEDDITKAFDIEIYETYFVINVSEYENVETILKKLYPNNTVIVPYDAFTLSYPFTLVISSYNESVVYNIDFSFDTKVVRLEFTKEVLEF